MIHNTDTAQDFIAIVNGHKLKFDAAQALSDGSDYA